MSDNFQSMYAITASYALNLPANFQTYCVSASYKITPDSPYYTKSSPPSKDEGVQEYFEWLGYRVSWDFNQRRGEQWYELYEDNHLVAQIDRGVPLEDIIMDMCQWHQGKSGISKSDFKVCGNGPRFDEMLKRVFEHQNNRPPKQLDFEFKV